MQNAHTNESFEAYKIIILVLKELQSVPVDESFISDAQRWCNANASGIYSLIDISYHAFGVESEGMQTLFSTLSLGYVEGLRPHLIAAILI